MFEMELTPLFWSYSIVSLIAYKIVISFLYVHPVLGRISIFTQLQHGKLSISDGDMLEEIDLDSVVSGVGRMGERRKRYGCFRMICENDVAAV